MACASCRAFFRAVLNVILGLYVAWSGIRNREGCKARPMKLPFRPSTWLHRRVLLMSHQPGETSPMSRRRTPIDLDGCWPSLPTCCLHLSGLSVEFHGREERNRGNNSIANRKPRGAPREQIYLRRTFGGPGVFDMGHGHTTQQSPKVGIHAMMDARGKIGKPDVSWEDCRGELIPNPTERC